MRTRKGRVGIAIVGLLIALAVLAPLVAPNDPFAIHPSQRFSPPSYVFPLGTDNLGRCLLSRLCYGARLSLAAAILASLSTMVIGVMLGAIAGYKGRYVDLVIMRVVDLLLAFPPLILALAVTGILGVGFKSVLVGVVSVWWATYARLMRGLVLSLRELAFVEAARVSGVDSFRMITRHIIPNAFVPLVTYATLDIGGLVLVIAGFNFLGLGAQPPAPEWGTMLYDGRAYLRSAPQLMIYPGLAIMLAVLGFSLLGDGLRDVLDPRFRSLTRGVSGWRS